MHQEPVHQEPVVEESEEEAPAGEELEEEEPEDWVYYPLEIALLHFAAAAGALGAAWKKA